MDERRVRVLPDDLANRIAAGEVVERPASVVKELVENSIDAGASHVRVQVEDAGKSLVAVEDDGAGMPREDALLALERHATSKLSSDEDLERIETLGFRGEALPSIASVSRFTLTTQPRGSSEATRLRVEGGRLLAAETVGAPRGTSVEVRDLFYNVPARRKFLKGDATELRNIVETVTLLALVNPNVGFELRSGARPLLAVPGGLGMEARTADLVGSDAAGGLFWGHFTSDGRELSFAFAAPHENRSHRRGVRLFVNGRPVQDRLLFRAVLEGFRGTLPPDRHPVALLWLRLPPEEVDVNVHPAKREVRFRDEGRLFRWVAGCVAEALGGAAGAPRQKDDAPVVVPERSSSDARDFSPASSHRERVAEALASYGARSADLSRAWGQPPAPPQRFASTAPRVPASLLPEMTPRPSRFGALRFLGSFDATYLLFEDAGSRELVLLDQHAAHERLLFEALLSDRTERGQQLLLPVTLECGTAEMAAFEERGADLEALGFRVEAFGPRSLAVTEAPAAVTPSAVEEMVREALGAEDLLADAGGLTSRREALAARAACAAAVKARSALLPSEAEELLRRLDGLKNPGHCPHGRPTMVRLSRGELEKMFRRT